MFKDFNVAGMKANKISFEKAKDLVLNKLYTISVIMSLIIVI